MTRSVTDILTSANNEAHRETNRVLWDRIDDIIDSGRVNADDTIYRDKSLPESEWNAVAEGSICTLLCDETNAEVRNWFIAQGIRF